MENNEVRKKGFKRQWNNQKKKKSKGKIGGGEKERNNEAREKKKKKNFTTISGKWKIVFQLGANNFTS